MKSSGAVDLRGRVIHLYSPSVTDWDFNSSHYYGRTQATGVVGVSQPVVDAMVDRGVTTLLGLQPGDVAEAWRRLTPDYVAGDRIAIKINLNNSSTCNSTVAAIDAIAQPINAVVRGLKLRGVRDQDILVYDAIRSFPLASTTSLQALTSCFTTVITAAGTLLPSAAATQTPAYSSTHPAVACR